MKNFSFLEFIRDIGKHITVNYMMAKDSVKKRISSEAKEGMSYTEFSYQLVQGTDFLHLFQTMDCKLQMGGSDQWGNIVTGTELIRRKTGGEAFALTSPLITKSDGTKFGKTESGNVWLNAEKTSPYKFYQFWLNVSDEDAARYVKVFTMLSKEEAESLIYEHQQHPHLRILQKRLADEVTSMTHGQEELENAKEASGILFGKGTTDSLKRMDEKTFLSVFEGVSRHKVEKSGIARGLSVVTLLTEKTDIFASKGEFRRLTSGGGLSINKKKVKDTDLLIDPSFLLNERYILVQKGKKNYFLIVAE
jgi:tyrosyl-tRNA synthetase